MLDLYLYGNYAAKALKAAQERKLQATKYMPSGMSLSLSLVKHELCISIKNGEMKLQYDALYGLCSSLSIGAQTIDLLPQVMRPFQLRLENRSLVAEDDTAGRLEQTSAIFRQIEATPARKHKDCGSGEC